MKRTIPLVAVAIMAAMAWQPQLWPQGLAQEKQAEAKGTEGTWTEVCSEHAGKLVRSPREYWKNPMPDFPSDWNALWKISNGKIEKGPEGKWRPKERWRCIMHPGGKPGTLDGVLLDINGKELPETMWLGIYELKDDFLLICLNSDDPPVRPEKLATSAKERGTFLFLLRRNKTK